MDCQKCTTFNLRTSESDIYHMKDNINNELKLLIETEQPLIRHIKEPNVNMVKQSKKKKRVLSSLDICISIFVVTPCVVGCWRGIWTIMDIYGVYFPMWESFLVGLLGHVILALGQDVFHYIIVEKEKNSLTTKIITVFLTKFYIITFNLISNMIWRSAWLIFDRYTHVQYAPSGTVKIEGVSTALWFITVCMLVLFCLKGLRNTLSPPFYIALDSKDEVFLFSTRYIYKIISMTILATKKQPMSIQNRTMLAEKLMSSESVNVENIQPPQPFGVRSIGPMPHKFTPTTANPTISTTKTTTVSFPQLTSFRHNYQPKSIQDIINYITKTKSYNHDRYENVSKEIDKLQAMSQKVNYTGRFSNGDPFFRFKPTDPSEINLLATASFRFAPPVWKNFQGLYHQPSQLPNNPQKYMTPPNTQLVEDSSVQETVRNFAKPFVVTLNIFPMESDTAAPYNRFGQKLFSPKAYGQNFPMFQGDPRSKDDGKFGKITIHLNVFPENISPHFNKEIDNYAETTVNKVRFV